MAITITTTVSGATSNSYISLAEAVVYASEHIEGTAFSGLANDDTKSQYLLMAARVLDKALRWRGAKNAATQRLEFPRDIQPFLGSQTAVSSIPEEVKRAQFEQAVYLAKHGMSARDELRAEGVQQLSVGRGASETLEQRRTISLAPLAFEEVEVFIRKQGVTV